MIIIAPNWDGFFYIMCDVNDQVAEVFLDKRKVMCFEQFIMLVTHLDGLQLNYTMSGEELLVVLFILEKHRPYLIR